MSDTTKDNKKPPVITLIVDDEIVRETTEIAKKKKSTKAQAYRELLMIGIREFNRDWNEKNKEDKIST